MISQNANFSITKSDDIYILCLTNNKILNESTIIQINKDIMDLVEGKNNLKLVINFKYVKYLSSSVLSKLVAVQKKVGSLNGKMVLCSMDPILVRIFEITQLHKFFNIVEDEKSAISILK